MIYYVMIYIKYEQDFSHVGWVTIIEQIKTEQYIDRSEKRKANPWESHACNADIKQQLSLYIENSFGTAHLYVYPGK